ncbi:hypothetical protein Bhyg_09816 [Pseudolycoriella hygida]|uniref:Uncharacterized protein n=1 Tax=Pseudolycoriella hygida TaxID=35572 RepID=A0A9Q0MS98_9DIPT|nr:hypothetical protein Bhyg_09816 [Pseudolycoriella hygida]
MEAAFWVTLIFILSYFVAVSKGDAMSNEGTWYVPLKN